jgi:CheY-like chemotaxis protein
LTADCGDQALAKFARHRHEIALVLTDVMMPRMTGIKLAERLLRLRPALPILFMSGTEPSAAGSCPLLVKPFTARQLLTQVSALIPASPRRKDVKTEFRVSRKRPIANRSPGQ